MEFKYPNFLQGILVHVCLICGFSFAGSSATVWRSRVTLDLTWKTQKEKMILCRDWRPWKSTWILTVSTARTSAWLKLIASVHHCKLQLHPDKTFIYVNIARTERSWNCVLVRNWTFVSFCSYRSCGGGECPPAVRGPRMEKRALTSPLDDQHEIICSDILKRLLEMST